MGTKLAAITQAIARAAVVATEVEVQALATATGVCSSGVRSATHTQQGH